MDEFLRQYYSLITHSVEFLAAVTGLCCLKKYKSPAAKYFIYFLVYAFFVDFLGRYPSHFRSLDVFHVIQNTIFEKNHWFYALFWSLGSALFFTFFYNRVLTNRAYKKISLWVATCFLVFVIAYIVLDIERFFTAFSPPILVFAAVTIMINVCFYFFEMLQNDTILLFYKSLYFYISAALFFWWLITTPLGFYDIYFSTADWNFVFLKWQIFLFANLFMYLSFTFALIYCKPEHD